MSTTEKRKKYEALAQRAETEFRSNPTAYKKKLKRLALLGYLYMFMVLLLCVGFMALIVYLTISTSWFWVLLIKKKLIVVVVIVMYIILRAMAVKIPTPEGIRITKKQAPALFKHIEDMRSQLNTPKIHEVIIIEDLNAAIQQTPRLGIFGWHKNSLMLGAELLMALDEDEVLAVVAHELGHLSGGHAKFNAWIYRVRISWMNIMMSMSGMNGVAAWLFAKFFNWYAPYFNAYSFALARANEFEADQVAVQVTSKEAFVSGLTKVHVMSEWYGEIYWDALYKSAFDEAKVAKHVFSDLSEKVSQQSLSAEIVKTKVAKYLQAKTGYEDTHPALLDRVASYSVEPNFVFEAPRSAANVWFKGQWKGILSEMDSQWAINNKLSWAHYHKQGQEAKERLKELEKEDLKSEELVEKANIISFLYGSKKALATYKEIYQNDKDNPDALYHLGAALIERKNEKGLDLLHRLMKSDPHVYDAGNLLLNYYKENNLEDKAQEVLLKMESQQDKDEVFYNEVNTLSVQDELLAVNFNDEEQQAFNAFLEKCSYFKKAWLARKTIESYPEVKMYIVLFHPHNRESNDSLFEFFQNHWPIEGYYMLVDVENSRIAKLIKKAGEQVV